MELYFRNWWTRIMNNVMGLPHLSVYIISYISLNFSLNSHIGWPLNLTFCGPPYYIYIEHWFHSASSLPCYFVIIISLFVFLVFHISYSSFFWPLFFSFPLHIYFVILYIDSYIILFGHLFILFWPWRRQRIILIVFLLLSIIIR